MYCFLGVRSATWSACCPASPLATISILLPLTSVHQAGRRHPDAVGIFYGCNRRAICSILLNLPGHPPHAVTCPTASR